MAQSKTIGIDCSYYLHRAFNVAATRRALPHLKKNTLTLFLQLVCQDIVTLRGTHALLCFDAPNSFRYDIYPEYKANRREGKSRNSTEVTRADGSRVTVDLTPGALVKDARRIAELAGLTGGYVKRYEADDLMASMKASVPGKKVFGTRDKDIAYLVDEETSLWWPKEQKLITVKEVVKYWGVQPHMMRDYLCLLGDEVDNIPGVDNMGPKTAVKLLTEHGSIAAALKDKKWLDKLKPFKNRLQIARKLVTMRNDVTFDLDDLVIKDMDQELLQYVWEAPKALKDLGEARKASKMKGLFGR